MLNHHFSHFFMVKQCETTIFHGSPPSFLGAQRPIVLGASAALPVLLQKGSDHLAFRGLYLIIQQRWFISKQWWWGLNHHVFFVQPPFFSMPPSKQPRPTHHVPNPGGASPCPALENVQPKRVDSKYRNLGSSGKQKSKLADHFQKECR